MSEIRLVERDEKILREITRWRIVLSRHITELANFSGQRACERRLKKLALAGYIERKRVLYGMPNIYSLAKAGFAVIGEKQRPHEIRVEQIRHDVAVLDTAIYLHRVKGIDFSQMTTERELHSQDGFGKRKHRPDFVIAHKGKKYSVEVELSLKAKSRLEQNIKSNFMDYDHQIWVVPDKECRIYQILADSRRQYPTMSILGLEEVQKK